MFLSLTLLTCTGFNLAANQVAETPAAVAGLNENDMAYISQITRDIKEFIESIKDYVDEWQNAKVKKSLNHYIQVFEQKLDEFENSILKTHKETLSQCLLDKNSAYYQSLKITDEILKELHQQLKNVRAILSDPKKTITSTKLATALGEQSNLFRSKFDQLDQKLAKLHIHFQELELESLINEIVLIRAQINIAKHAPEFNSAEKMKLVKIIDTMMKIR